MNNTNNIAKIKKYFNLTRGKMSSVKRFDTENYTILINDFMFLKTTKNKADRLGITETYNNMNLLNDILLICEGLNIFLDTCDSTKIIYENRLILKSEGVLLAVSKDYENFKTFQRINEKHYTKFENHTLVKNIIYSNSIWFGRASLDSTILNDLYDKIDDIKKLEKLI